MQWQDSFTRATAPVGDPAALPNTLLVFAHPDDEVVALGARLPRFHAAHLVHVTDGAPRDEQGCRAYGFTTVQAYRQARAQELLRALNLARIGDISRDCLGIPDQEASLHLPLLSRQILHFLLERKPEVVFTHPYEGGHPDHDACAFAVHRAVAQWEATHGSAPLIVECAFYHAGPKGMEAGTFLSHPQSTLHTFFELSKEERLRKQALLACFPTQAQMLSSVPTASESYRVAPDYDFSKPAHPAPVLYDLQSWGTTSQQFCALARQAQDSLDEEVAGTYR